MKSIFQNTTFPTILMFGGLAFIMWPKMLKLLGIIQYDQSWRPVFLIGGLLMILVGSALQLYQGKENKTQIIKDYLIKLALVIFILGSMIITGIIAKPSFLQW